MWLVQVHVTVYDAEAPPSRPTAEQFFRDSYAEFCKLDGLVDPDVLAVLGDGTIIFSAVLDYEDRLEGLRFALDAVRTALHAAGGDTAEWEQRAANIVHAAQTTTSLVVACSV